MPEQMKVLRKRPGFVSPINGINFTPCEGGSISDPVSADMAALFAGVPGYELVTDDGGAAARAKAEAEAKAREEAEAHALVEAEMKAKAEAEAKAKEEAEAKAKEEAEKAAAEAGAAANGGSELPLESPKPVQDAKPKAKGK